MLPTASAIATTREAARRPFRSVSSAIIVTAFHSNDSMLQRLVQFIKPLVAGLGGPGLVAVAFLDSSFLSFPEVPDLLMVALVARNPGWWMYYAAITTVGSCAGCYALYLVARRGGEAMFRKRFKQSTFD